MASERKGTEQAAEQLLSAVERIVDDVQHLIARVESIKQETAAIKNENHRLSVGSERIIMFYSRRSAIAGGVTGIPAVLPGFGPLMAMTGGALVDMMFMLKHDVEMALSLTYLHGYDIREEKERWMAYLLASINTYKVQTDRNFFVDLAEVEAEAIAKHTPWQMSKIVVAVLTKLLLLRLSMRFLKALPLVGIVVGATTNRILTQAVGWRCVDALERRRLIRDNDVQVIDAKLKD